MTKTNPQNAVMAEKHTEGPWEYVPSTEHHGPYVSSYAGDVADCYVMSNPTAASVRNGGDSYPVPHCGEQADANARLIAQAPAMLDALKQAAETFKPYDRFQVDVEAMRQIKAVIAAATGEAHD